MGKGYVMLGCVRYLLVRIRVGLVSYYSIA
jgi:hypothetical protein